MKTGFGQWRQGALKAARKPVPEGLFANRFLRAWMKAQGMTRP